MAENWGCPDTVDTNGLTPMVHVHVPGTPLHGLPSQYLYGTTCSRVNAIVDHLLQTLVVCWTNEYLCRHLASGVSIVKHLCQTVTGNLTYTRLKIYH